MKGEHKFDAHLELHPAGTVAVIENEDFKLFESNAIILYLGRKYASKYYPKDVEQAAITDQWIDYSTNCNGANVIKITFNKFFVKFLGLSHI